MADYGYRCLGCGPFERRADPRAPGVPAACPSCGEPSPRSFSAPGARSPRRERQLAGVGRPGRERIERAHGGVATTGRLPAGRHFHGGAPVVPAGRVGPGRPWQIGH